MPTLTAMSLVAITWLPLFFVFTGVGLTAAHLLRTRARRAGDWFKCFWIGWALALILLQLWHLAFPVDWRPLLVLALVGAAGLVLHRRELWHLASRVAPANWLFCLVLLLLTLRAANRAIGEPWNIDTAFYHLSSIRWAATYPIVPGLGNLHYPLAINSAYFLYVAMLGIGPWAGRAYHLANGLLLLAALAQATVGLFNATRRLGRPATYDLFLALSLPALLTQAVAEPTAYDRIYTRLVCSPTPDLPVFVLGVLAAAELLAFLENGRQSRQESAFAFVSVVLLCVAGMLVKLTFAVFGGAALLVAFGLAAGRRAKEPNAIGARPLLAGAVVVALGIGVWTARSVILSGYVAYPSPVVSVPVGWRMPKAIVTAEAESVRSCARWPSSLLSGLPQWHEQEERGEWIVPWLTAMPHMAFWTLVLPCALVLLACGVGLYRRMRGVHGGRQMRLCLLFFGPLALGAAFWFFTAPAPRFAGALFWAAAAGALVVVVNGLEEPKRTLAARWLAAFSVGLSLYLFYAVKVTGPGLDHGLHPAPKVAMTTFVTRSGVRVLVPATEGAGMMSYCWDAPVPCTPKPDPNLRLRKEGDIRAGFVLDGAAPERVRGG